MAMAIAAAACATAAVVVYRRIKQRWHQGNVLVILKQFQSACAMPPSLLREVAEAMAMEMQAGLVYDGGSRLKMLPSFVESLPTGLVSYFPILNIFTMISLGNLLINFHIHN